MTYEIFKETILSEIKNYFGDGVTVTINRVVKNNNLILDGLVIKDNRTNIAPTIYLNYYYKSLAEDNRELKDIIDDILRTYENHKCSEVFDPSIFTDFEKAKKRIVFKLINTRSNEDLLNSIPHINFLDLSIAFYYLLDSTISGNATILIKNEHLSYWNINTIEELYNIAKKNTPELLPAKISSMIDMLSESMPSEDILPDDLESIPMFIITNKNMINGSAAILYEGVLKSFAEKIGKDLYLLPSSISEMIILPFDESLDSEYLKNMVSEVNNTVVAKEEILSYSVYRYHLDTDTITQF